MEITNARQFQSYDGGNTSIEATINGTEMSVPLVVGNKQYDEIMRQVDAGTLTIADADQYEHSGVRETLCKT